MSRYRWMLAGVVAALAVAVIFTSAVRSAPPGTSTATGSAALIPADSRMPAAGFTGLDGWLNSNPLTIGELRGRVVLVDFWTFSCVNCVRTIPHLQHLEQAYGGKGLVIVGVHSPEFDFEKQRGNVAAAVRRLGVTWAVALDSQMSTWNGYGNQYWPAEYLVDQAGRVAYIHDGEGDYDVTESAVAALLGVAAAPPPAAPAPTIGAQTPELYAGSDRGQLADGESYGPTGQEVSYADPGGPHDSDRIAVTGRWSDHGQYLVSSSTGHIRLSFSAHDVYAVVGPDAGSAVHLTVTVDGAAVAAEKSGPDLSPGGVTVESQQLYHLLTGESGSARHVIDVAVPAGLRLYTFTFG